MRRLITILVVLTVVALATINGVAERYNAGPEKIIFQYANKERAARGLLQLKWSDDLAKAARYHAVRMAQQNTLSHQFRGESDPAGRAREAGAHFSAMAENVAEGPTPESLHEQWMKSPPHRANLLDPELNTMGVGIAQRNGQIFAVQDFSAALADLTLQQQEQRVSATLGAKGLRLAKGNADARQACDPERSLNDYGSGPRAMFVMRYSTSDLDNLPAALEQKVRSGKYKTAAIGACSPADAVAYSQYHVAVLLYE